MHQPLLNGKKYFNIHIKEKNDKLFDPHNRKTVQYTDFTVKAPDHEELYLRHLQSIVDEH